MITPKGITALTILVVVWLLVVLGLVGLGIYRQRQRVEQAIAQDPGPFCVRIALGYDLIRCYDVDTGNFCYLRGEESISCVAGPFVERVPMLR